MAAQNPESEFSELFDQEEIPQEQPRDVPRIDAQTTDASFNGIVEMLRPSSILRSVDDVLGRESFPGGAALLDSLMHGSAGFQPAPLGRGDASPLGSAGFQPAPLGRGDASPLGNAGFQPAPLGRG